jgi:hypothetical protein
MSKLLLMLMAGLAATTLMVGCQTAGKKGECCPADGAKAAAVNPCGPSCTCADCAKLGNCCGKCACCVKK